MMMISKNSSFLIALLLAAPLSMAQVKFDDRFIDKSLRIDFVLTGSSGEETAAPLQLYQEPFWSGPRTNLIEPLSYGSYQIVLQDRESGDTIYTRSFNTLFEEWRTTAEAKQHKESWVNSIVTPFPKKPVMVTLNSRDRHNPVFHKLFDMKLEPDDLIIDKSEKPSYPAFVLQEKGAPAEKVDLLFLGEGYTADQLKLFEADARRFTEALFTFPPFSNHRDDFNVRAVCAPSVHEGCDVSGEGIFKNTVLNTGFYTFGVERYLTTRDMRSIRDLSANVPCDAVFILVNEERYGGGGIYNLYAIGTAHNRLTPQVFVHELGHSFAGLADEYYTSTVAYEDFHKLNYEPWEPNITTLIDFGSKWKAMVDREEGVGTYEGAAYVAKGIYRPAEHCMMKDYHPFCPVCSKTIENMIDYLCGRSL